MKRFLTKFAWLAIVAPGSCGMVACVDQGADEELAATESAVTYAWCVDHDCADLNVRVLKDNYYTTTIVLGDACDIDGTGLLVGNHGTLSAGSSLLTIYTPSTGVKKGYTIPGMSPGFSYLLPVKVPKNSTVTVDVNDSVMERNESGNSYKYYCI
jgi:hypothetical protein